MGHFKKALLGATILLAGSVGLAQAAVISASSFVDGATTSNLGNGFTGVADGVTGATFGLRTGLPFIGTSVGINSAGLTGGNAVNGEIGGTETLSINSNPVMVNSLNGFTVAFLYAAGNQGDTVNEISLLAVTNAGVTTSLTLTTAPDGNTAILSGASGTVTTISPGNGSNYGIFAVSNLNLAFTNLTFSAGAAGNSAPAGDYALASVTYSAPTAVPEPASMALLGAGLVGVGVFRRRRAK